MTPPPLFVSEKIDDFRTDDMIEGEPTDEAEGTDRLLHELRSWASHDFDSALIWTTNHLTTADIHDAALEAICYGLSETNPAAAVEWASAFQLEKRHGALMENLVYQWALADTASALAWATNQPAGMQRDQCLTRVALALIQTQPMDAARLIVELIPPGDAQSEAAMMILHRWATSDLWKASEWVAHFPEGPLRTRALDELNGIWLEQEEINRGP